MDFGILPNVVSGGITAGINTIFGKKLADYNAKLNYKYNEMAAKNADARTRALYEDYMSPASRIAQLKAAGLSPSLYADGAGAGSQGVTAGAQGAGAGGVGIPTNVMPALDAAQVRLANAQADKAEAEAETERGDNARGAAGITLLEQEVLKKIEETKNTTLHNAYMEYENALKSVQLSYEASTLDYKVKKYVKEVEYFDYFTRSAKVRAEIDENTKNDVEKLVNLKTKDLMADILLKEVQKNLGEQSIKLQKQEVEDLINQIENRNKITKVNEDTLKQNIREWVVTNGIITDPNAKWSDIVQRNIFSEKSIEMLVRLIEALK